LVSVVGRKAIYAIPVKVKVDMDVTVIGRYYGQWLPVARDIHALP